MILIAEQNSGITTVIDNWFNCSGSTITCKNLVSLYEALFNQISKDDQFCIEQAIINPVDKMWDFDLYRWENWREFTETLKN